MNEVVDRKKEIADLKNDDFHQMNELVVRKKVDVVPMDVLAARGKERIVLMNTKAVPMNDGVVLTNVRVAYRSVGDPSLQTTHASMIANLAIQLFHRFEFCVHQEILKVAEL